MQRSSTLCTFILGIFLCFKFWTVWVARLEHTSELICQLRWLLNLFIGYRYKKDYTFYGIVLNLFLFLFPKWAIVCGINCYMWIAISIVQYGTTAKFFLLLSVYVLSVIFTSLTSHNICETLIQKFLLIVYIFWCHSRRTSTQNL